MVNKQYNNMALKQNISNSNYPSVVRATLGITEDVTELYIKITSLHQQEQSCEVRADFFHRVLQEKRMKMMNIYTS